MDAQAVVADVTLCADGNPGSRAARPALAEVLDRFEAEPRIEDLAAGRDLAAWVTSDG